MQKISFLSNIFYLLRITATEVTTQVHTIFSNIKYRLQGNLANQKF